MIAAMGCHIDLVALHVAGGVAYIAPITEPFTLPVF